MPPNRPDFFRSRALIATACQRISIGVSLASDLLVIGGVLRRRADSSVRCRHSVVFCPSSSIDCEFVAMAASDVPVQLLYFEILAGLGNNDTKSPKFCFFKSF